MSKIKNNILLRDIRFEDDKLLMEMNNDSYISKYVVGSPMIVTLEQQRKWINNLSQEKNTKRFIIECNNKSVGTVIISKIDKINLTANINIKISQGNRGHGIGTESVKLALEYCFEELGLVCITAHVLSYNHASKILFEKCGFVNEGVLRSRIIKNDQRQDLISFSILNFEYLENLQNERNR